MGSLSEEVTRANLRQWQALTQGPTDYALPFRDAGGAAAERAGGWEALNAQVRALRPLPERATCDCCGEDADLAEMVQGRYADIYCRPCWEAPLLAEDEL